MIFFPKEVVALGALAEGARKQELHAVRVGLGADGFWCFAATDGVRVVFVRGPSNPEHDEAALAQKLDSAGHETPQVLVPAREFVAACKVLGAGARAGRKLCLHLGRERISLVGEGCVARAGVMGDDGRFPELERAIPKTPPLVSVQLDGEHLTSLVRLLAQLARTGGGQPTPVTLHWWRDDAPVALTAQGPDGVAIDAVLAVMS